MQTFQPNQTPGLDCGRNALGAGYLAALKFKSPCNSQVFALWGILSSFFSHLSESIRDRTAINRLDSTRLFLSI
jgi:hypothetical protein